MTTMDGRPDRETIQVERRLRGVRAALARLAEHPLADLDAEARDALARAAGDFTTTVGAVLAGLRRAGRAAGGLPADDRLVNAEELLSWATADQAEVGPMDVREAAWAAGRVAYARHRVRLAGGEPVARAVHPPALRPELLRLLDSLADDELEAACGAILAAVSAARGDDDGWVGFGPRADRARVP